jgi:hypothetical protein
MQKLILEYFNGNRNIISSIIGPISNIAIASSIDPTGKGNGL